MLLVTATHSCTPAHDGAIVDRQGTVAAGVSITSSLVCIGGTVYKVNSSVTVVP